MSIPTCPYLNVHTHAAEERPKPLRLRWRLPSTYPLAQKKKGWATPKPSALASLRIYCIYDIGIVCIVWLAVQSTRGVVSLIDSCAANFLMHVAALFSFSQFAGSSFRRLIRTTPCSLWRPSFFSHLLRFTSKGSPPSTRIMVTDVLRFWIYCSTSGSQTHFSHLLKWSLNITLEPRSWGLYPFFFFFSYSFFCQHSTVCPQ